MIPAGTLGHHWCCQLSFQGGIFGSLAGRKLCVCVRVSHTQHCPLLCFYLDVGVGRLRVGEEGQEGFMVFEVRASFYFLLLMGLLPRR